MRSQEQIAALITDAQERLKIRGGIYYFNLHSCCPMGMAMSSIFDSFRHAEIAFEMVTKIFRNLPSTQSDNSGVIAAKTIAFLLNVEVNLVLAVSNAHFYKGLSLEEITEQLSKNSFDVKKYLPSYLTR